MTSNVSDDCNNYLQQLLAQAGSILSGASDDGTKAQFFDVLREFFDQADAWLEAISVTVVPASLDYKLEPISGRIIRLWSVNDLNNIPVHALMPVPGRLHFMYPVNQPQQMTATVVKNVDNPLDEFPPDFPDWVLPQYGLVLLAGLLGNMMIQPGSSYSDRPTGLYHLQRFRDGMMHARVATRLLNTVGAAAWAYPQQFRTSGQKGGVSTFNVHPSAFPPR